MNNKRIIDYVMQSPNNTNPAVLESMLEALIGDGGSSGGGGASASGAKVAIFDLSKIKDYEKIVVDESAHGVMYKLSDEVPTYDELLGGFCGRCGKLFFDDGSLMTDTSTFAVLDEDNLVNDEEMQVVGIMDYSYMSMSAEATEMFSAMVGVNVTPGLYATSSAIDLEAIRSEGVYNVLMWSL